MDGMVTWHNSHKEYLGREALQTLMQMRSVDHASTKVGITTFRATQFFLESDTISGLTIKACLDLRGTETRTGAYCFIASPNKELPVRSHDQTKIHSSGNLEVHTSLKMSEQIWH